MTSSPLRPAALILAALFGGVVAISAVFAQNSATSAGSSPTLAGRQPAEPWWVEKTAGGIYKPPMRPMWKLSDLKRMHAGQANWRQQIILDPEQDATYNSAAPGAKFGQRIHPDTPTVFVVIAGGLRFDVEGQQPVTAKRGSIINIMKTTVFSYEATGSDNALWVEVNPANYKTLYPASAPQPKAMSGGQVIKVAFAHVPAPYDGINQLHYNTFDGIARCDKPGAKVRDDHLFASPLLGWVNAEDNPCKTGRLNVGNAPVPGSGTLPPFNPDSNFGHMHAGPAEWWIVQVGKIVGKFEKQGEFHAEEGDVLYAAPMMWHQMAAEAASGPSVRLAMGGYELINMNNTGGQ